MLCLLRDSASRRLNAGDRTFPLDSDAQLSKTTKKLDFPAVRYLLSVSYGLSRLTAVLTPGLQTVHRSSDEYPPELAC